MNMIDDNFLLLLLCSNAVLLGIACLAVARFDRRCRRLDAFWASPTGTALAEKQNDAQQKHLQMTQRLEKRVGELQRTVKVMDMSKSPPSPGEERILPIENAQRMAKLGASVDDLTRACGLNIGEARLLQKLHWRAPNTVSA